MQHPFKSKGEVEWEIDDSPAKESDEGRCNFIIMVQKAVVYETDIFHKANFAYELQLLIAGGPTPEA